MQPSMSTCSSRLHRTLRRLNASIWTCADTPRAMGSAMHLASPLVAATDHASGRFAALSVLSVASRRWLPRSSEGILQGDELGGGEAVGQVLFQAVACWRVRPARPERTSTDAICRRGPTSGSCCWRNWSGNDSASELPVVDCSRSLAGTVKPVPPAWAARGQSWLFFRRCPVDNGVKAHEPYARRVENPRRPRHGHG